MAECSSFDLETAEHARRFLSKLQIIRHGASLGGVESLVSLPVLTSHYKQPPENLKAAGITEGTIRFSVGIENPNDLWADIEQALTQRISHTRSLLYKLSLEK